MKLFVVKVEWTIPIGASSKQFAESTAQTLLVEEHPEAQELGLYDTKATATLAKSLKDVPKTWRDTFVYNDEELDEIHVKDFFNGKLQEKITQSVNGELVRKLKDVVMIASEMGVSNKDLEDLFKKIVSEDG